MHHAAFEGCGCLVQHPLAGGAGPCRGTGLCRGAGLMDKDQMGQKSEGEGLGEEAGGGRDGGHMGTDKQREQGDYGPRDIGCREMDRQMDT